MLRRLGLGYYHGLSLFRCRHSIVPRPINLRPSCSHRRELSDSPAAAAAAAVKDPRWVMLSIFLRSMDDDSFVADAGNTAAADSLTSTGQHLRVSLEQAAPPASSFLRYNFVDTTAHGEVLAAHGDSVLFSIMRDNFVYRAGAAGRPASLSLLPTSELGRDINHRRNRERYLHRRTTGLLRRSDDELLVVELGFGNDCRVNVLRLGSPQWIVVNDDDGQRGGEILPKQWGSPDSVIPVGDRFLCWVKYSSGFLLCDMVDPNLVFRSIPRPAPPRHRCRCKLCEVCEHRPSLLLWGPWQGHVLELQILLHGDHLDDKPEYGTTDEQTTWVKDGVMDCEELWALPGYEGLPHVTPDNPVVSPENADVVCFKVSDYLLVGWNNGKVWMLEVDMRKKALFSVLHCPRDPGEHLPAKFHYNC